MYYVAEFALEYIFVELKKNLGNRNSRFFKKRSFLEKNKEIVSLRNMFLGSKKI